METALGASTAQVEVTRRRQKGNIKLKMLLSWEMAVIKLRATLSHASK